MKEKLISLENITKKFSVKSGEIIAIENVSMQIYSGEFIGIYGVSGSGKTTLLNLMGLVDQPTSGKIIIGDKDVSKISDIEIREYRNQYFGFLHQSFGLLHDFTAIENVELPLLIQDISDELRLEKCEKAMDKMELGDKYHAFISQLSGGQQQRIALARALVTEPKMILADEATGALDSLTGYKIVQMLRDIAHTGNTSVVLVTHDESYQDLFDKIYFLVDGKLE